MRAARAVWVLGVFERGLVEGCKSEAELLRACVGAGDCSSGPCGIRLGQGQDLPARL